MVTIRLSEEQIQKGKTQRIIKLNDVVKPNFIKELNLISYNSNWTIKEFFTPLEIACLTYGFDPDYFYCELNLLTIQSSHKKKSLDLLEKEYADFKNYILYEAKDAFDVLNEYQTKLQRMQFLFEIILDGLRFDKIQYDKNKNIVQLIRDYKSVKIHKFDIRNFLQLKNIESEFFETTNINNESDFYKIPKNHKCVTSKTKALIETLLYFIENETELHDAQSGVRDTIADYIIANNKYIIPETAIKKEIAPIINWTHKKEIKKT